MFFLHHLVLSQNNGALIIDKIQAQIVEEIFDMFLNGIGYQRISEICQSKIGRAHV